MKQLTRLMIIVLAVLTCTELAFAQRGRGGGRGGGGRGGGGFSARSHARPSVNHRPAARANVNRAARANVTRRDVNIDRDVNVNIDRDYDGCCYRRAPVARAAVATAVVAEAVDDDCDTVYVDGVAVTQCDGSPQFYGTTIIR